MITTVDIDAGKDEGPTLRRRRLAAELKKSREEAGFTQESVSRHFEWHSAKVTRIENARVPVTARDVNDLLTLYGVRDPDYREALLALARQGKQRTWWTDYRDVMRPGNFVGMEADASITRVWEPIVLPGLLQSEAYMRALIGTGRRHDPKESIERRVALRKMRQARLTAKVPLQLVALIDESVIHRVVGGPSVMQEQRRKLIEVAALPNVSMRIVPYGAGEHPFMGGSVALLEFPDVAHLDVIYLEGLAGDYYEEQPAEVKRYRDEFERLRSRALSETSTIALIERLLD
ncbi:helix-turn-helix domain-containing protein [Dactylosporangium aurantiacum]|uniref:Helix-turn-helix domain-containing protein n=1 Tax=Dactylosporangium aurantiacum TaxID=35754 RepID=A0A9Q9IB01_9ACTN|nr:helix-turn-helix transcriptional regulator [Dactylosporangium aurantiacum]MDG6107928.1 helix-turn-helix transcriptional regulator [Dactylosporangium aurantiacum]UWZ51771.1 helix-turn-helix domain-containing protein [Dactylosporangium aurantiacum]